MIPHSAGFRPEPRDDAPESVVEVEKLEHDVRDADTYVDAADPDPAEYALPDLVADGYSWTQSPSRGGA